jgi:hypothetical protein
VDYVKIYYVDINIAFVGYNENKKMVHGTSIKISKLLWHVRRPTNVP